MAKHMIVVSLRSKGLAAFNKSTVLDVKSHAINIIVDALDIILAAIVTIFSLSWTGWISVLITIIVGEKVYVSFCDPADARSHVSSRGLT